MCACLIDLAHCSYKDMVFELHLLSFQLDMEEGSRRRGAGGRSRGRERERERARAVIGPSKPLDPEEPDILKPKTLDFPITVTNGLPPLL